MDQTLIQPQLTDTGELAGPSADPGPATPVPPGVDNGQPLAPPAPTPNGASTPAPSQAGAQPPQPPLDPNSSAYLLQELLKNNKQKQDLAKVFQEEQQPDALYKYMPNGGVRTPSQFLRDWVYNFTQLNLHNPVYGSLAGQKYTPIEQQRLELAQSTQQTRLKAVMDQLGAVNSETGTLQSALGNARQIEHNQATEKAATDANVIKQGQLEEKTRNNDLVNGIKNAVLAEKSGIDSRKTDLLELFSRLKGYTNPMQAVVTWGLDTGYGDPSSPHFQEYQDTLAKIRLISAAPIPTTTSRVTQIPFLTTDPNDPSKQIIAYKPSYSSSNRAPTGSLPRLIQSIQDIKPVAPPPVVAQPGSSPPVPNTPVGKASATPPNPQAKVQQFIREKALPSIKDYSGNLAKVGMLDSSIGNIMSLKDMVNDPSVNKPSVGLQAFLNQHPANYKFAFGSNELAKMTDLDPKQAEYMRRFIQLSEQVNQVRGVMGAAGFRGEQGWNALQSMVGSPLGNKTALKELWRGLQQDFLTQRGPLYDSTQRFQNKASLPDDNIMNAYDFAYSNEDGINNKKVIDAIKSHGYRAR